MRLRLSKLRLAASLGTFGLVAAAIGALSPAGSVRAAPPPTSFKEQVLPIFEQHCVECHNPEGVGYKSISLDLRSYQGLMAGSHFGVAVIPSHPELSPLVATLQDKGHPFPLLQSFKGLKMPPVEAPLSPAELNTVIDWIREGAKDN